MFCTTECWDCHDVTCDSFMKQVDKDRQKLRKIQKTLFDIKSYLEYYMIGNLRFDDSQKQLQHMLDMINDVIKEV